jgi:Peptidase propeptide and YPEB domain
VATPSTDAGSRRGLRDRPLGRIAILVAVLLVALIASRSCASNTPEVSKDEAIDIAKGEISFAPDGVVVRNVPRSLDQRRVWAVSLFTGTATRPQLCQVVEVDADSGDVDAVHQC